MAMSYHMEARIKQDRLNRWAEQQRRTELEPQNQAVGDRLEDVGYKTKMDKVLTTDAGQFHQTRSNTASQRRDVPYETGVIFNKVVHDPNYNYRLERALGGNYLHVNPIYKIMYPQSYHLRRA